MCFSASELEVSLLVLPFSYVAEQLKLFSSYIQQGLEVELVCRCLFFLLRWVELRLPDSVCLTPPPAVPPLTW